ncbi:lytic murein transglycosylase [Saccharomonospora sp. NPDC006951]
MRRSQRKTGARRTSRRKRSAAALAAASLALVPFVGGGAVSVPMLLTGEGGPLGATGTLPEQSTLSPDVLAEAGDPLSLARQGIPAGVPIDGLSAGGGTSYPRANSAGIPAAVLAAYYKAERTLAGLSPGCRIDWSLLAGIGKVESGHANGGRVDGGGKTLSAILGPQLNGAGAFAAIGDTDGGLLDGDTAWDRAVGPMQFIPSTWRVYAADGNGDGVADPHNVFDATVAAGKYLCAGGGDLSDPAQRARAVFRYNHSDSYVRTVLLWAALYSRSAVATEGLSGPILASGVTVPGFGVPVGAAGGPGTKKGAPGAPKPPKVTPGKPPASGPPPTTTPPPGSGDPGTTPTTPPPTTPPPTTSPEDPTTTPTDPPPSCEPEEPSPDDPSTEPTESPAEPPTGQPDETTPDETTPTEPPPGTCTP